MAAARAADDTAMSADEDEEAGLRLAAMSADESSPDGAGIGSASSWGVGSKLIDTGAGGGALATRMRSMIRARCIGDVPVGRL